MKLSMPILCRALAQSLFSAHAALSISFLLIFFGALAESYIRKNWYENWILSAEQETRLISHYILRVEPSWFPRAYEYLFVPKEILTERLVESSAWSLDNERKNFSISQRTINDFEPYVDQWWSHVKICQSLNFTPETGCANNAESRAPAAIRNEFVERYQEGHVVDFSGVFPGFYPRPEWSERFCNISPLAVDVQIAQHVASDKLVRQYSNHLDIQIDNVRADRLETVQPGNCIDVSRLSYDLNPARRPKSRFFFSAEFAHRDIADWFYRVWAKHHQPKLNDTEFLEAYESVMLEEREFRGRKLCVDDAARSEWLSIGDVECSSEDKARWFMSGIDLADGSRISFADAVGVVHPSHVFDFGEDGELSVNNERLEKTLSEMRALGRRVSQEYRLEQNWRDRQPRFFLSMDDTQVHDLNGPLKDGVWIANLPSETILGETISSPGRGVLLSITNLTVAGQKAATHGTRSIASRSALYQAMENHGSNRRFGVDAPVGAVIRDHASGRQTAYIARFRFNLNSWQAFDTRFEQFDALSAGLLLSLPLVDTFVGWEDRQRYAYYRQIDPGGYVFGDIVGQIGGGIGVGSLISRLVRRLPRIGKLSGAAGGSIARGMLAGGIEAALAYAYERNRTSIFTPPEIALENAETSAQYGFAFGAMADMFGGSRKKLKR